jgi:hypothetical protein
MQSLLNPRLHLRVLAVRDGGRGWPRALAIHTEMTEWAARIGRFGAAVLIAAAAIAPPRKSFTIIGGLGTFRVVDDSSGFMGRYALQPTFHGATHRVQDSSLTSREVIVTKAVIAVRANARRC